MQGSQKAAMPGHRERSGFAQREPPCLSRPVSGLASGMHPADRTFPCRRHSGHGGLTLAYRCVGSAGIASAWMRTGFPFHPRGSDDPWDT